jgi:hypothetical protein
MSFFHKKKFLPRFLGSIGNTIKLVFNLIEDTRDANTNAVYLISLGPPFHCVTLLPMDVMEVWFNIKVLRAGLEQQYSRLSFL